jgi:hypothetical protein
MAQVLEIRNLCDICLTHFDGKETPAETYRVDVTIAGEKESPRPFVVELCPEHGAELANAVLALVALGRSPDKAPRTPAATPARRLRKDATPIPAGAITCPECGHVSPTHSALRVHLSKVHDKTLSDAGLAPARETCSACNSRFSNKQGLAAHTRVRHPGRAKHSA